MADSYFIAPSGEVIAVDAAQAQAFAGARGYVPASPDQIKDYQTQQKYGGAVEGAKAFGEHAASALTGGLSDLAERAAGVSPDAMQGRETAHPVASAAGTAVGVAAPLVSTLGGASAFTAPALIARAGEAAVPKALGKIAGKAVQLGTEGTLYGAGNVVHEAALGDPHLTAQSALASIGVSGLLGAGLGAAGGVLGKMAGEFSGGDFRAKVISMLDDAEGHSNLNATNAMPAKVKAVIRNKGAAIGNDARDLGILTNPWTDSPDAILERAQGVISKAGETQGQLTGAADAVEGAPRFTWDKVAGTAQGKILTALRREGSTVGVADQVESVFARFQQAYEGREMGIVDIHKLRQDLDAEIYKFGKSLDPFQKPTGGPLTRFRAHLTSEIEDGLKAAGQDVGAWREANRAIEVGKTMEMLAESGVERSAANNAVHLTGTLGGMAGLISGGPVAGAALGMGSEMVRRRGASAVGALARGLKNLLEGDAAENLVNKTAAAIQAERRAGQDTIVQQASSGRAEAAKFAALDGPQPTTPQAIAAEQDAQSIAGRVEAEKLRRVEAGRTPGTGGSASVEEARARADALRTAEQMGAASGVEPGVTPQNSNEAERLAYAMGLRQRPAGTPIATVATLTLLERTQQAIHDKIDSHISDVIAARAAKVGRGEVSAGIAHIFGEDAESAAASFKKHADEIRGLASDPDRMLTALSAQTDGLHEHAPQTAQALAATSTSAVSFLASKLPPSMKPGPLGDPFPPTQADIATYLRYKEAVEHPLSVLSQARAGTLTREGIEAVRAVYPALFAKMQASIVEKLATTKSVPYAQRLMLSMIMGQDLDGSASPQAILRNQMAFATPPPMPPKGGTKAGKITLHSRMETSAQKAAHGDK